MKFSDFTLETEYKCACGKTHYALADDAIIGKGVIARLPDVVKRYNAKKVFVLADKNTYAAAGEKVVSVLGGAGIEFKKYVFTEPDLKPDDRTVGDAALHFDRNCDMLVSVGSGVINDTSKIVAALAGIPYVIVATAPSMDGYASASSSMEVSGLKTTVASKCPNVIIGDVDVLKNAPIRMLKSGLGDMIAKYVSICEWRISNLINGEYYCEYIADLVRRARDKCVSNADGLLRRDEKAVEAVFEGLVIGGIAMNYATISRPASGVEHYFSHVWDMRGLEFGTPVDFHGIQCAIATKLASEIYEQVVGITPDKKKALAYADAFDFDEWSRELRALLGKGAEAMIALETKEKKYDKSKHAARLDKLIANWDEIKKIIKEEVPSSAELDALLHKIEAPASPAEIGCGENLTTVFKATKDIRDKYVLSRLCWDLGIIDEIKF